MWTDADRDYGHDDRERTPWDPAGWGRDTLACLAFFTRLPGYRDDSRAPVALSRALRAAPVAGLVAGIVGALILWLSATIGLSPLVTAALAVAAGVAVTGALHEDGLSDTADGLAGGWRREDRLEIMRDSRIGTYGALALIFAVAVRTGTLASILAANGRGVTMFVLISAEAVSRMGPVWLMRALPAARADGQSASAGRPDSRAVWQGTVLAGIVAFLLMASAGGVLATAFALACSGLAVLGMKALAQTTIGGQTGDVAGATQQAALIAFLLAAAAALPG